MYNAIFSGPTPDVAGEDDMEQAVRNAKDWFQQCEMRSGTEKRAAESLERARYCLGQALGDMNEALRMSQMDMFGGGTFTVSMKDPLPMIPPWRLPTTVLCVVHANILPLPRT